MGQEPVRVNLKSMFLVLIVVAVLAIFGVGAIGNGDPLWFWPNLNEEPERIVIYRNGCTVELISGQPGFAELTRALNENLPQYEGYSNSYGFSIDSLNRYRQKEYALEIFYPEPITIHSPYGFGHPDSLMIPLSSDFAETRSIFGGHNGDYWAGALRLKSIAAIQGAANAIPCQK